MTEAGRVTAAEVEEIVCAPLNRPNDVEIGPVDQQARPAVRGNRSRLPYQRESRARADRPPYNPTCDINPTSWSS